MSLLNSASLVVTPNAYKEGTLYSVIPNSTLGDMTVVRATTATRVNSAGLIELVPYNLLQYSEQFNNAAWSTQDATITANSTTAPNGTLTADTFTRTANTAFLYATNAFSLITGSYSISVYAKANATSSFRLDLGSSGLSQGVTCTFNLSTATAGTPILYGSASSFVATIENVGNGWYRCSLSGNLISANYYAELAITTTGSIYIWGAQLNDGSLKDYLRTETRLNIPRLDYSNGTCPSLLVEPQRSNISLYSEQFDNAAWLKYRLDLGTNTQVSPSGVQNADTFTSSVGQSIVPAIASTSITFLGNTNYSLSIFAKVLGNTNTFSLTYVDNVVGYTGGSAVYNLATQVVTITQSPNASVTASMQDYGNGWYRLVLNFLTIATPTFNYFQYGITTANTANTFAIWGAQLEAGSYPTSYIPTTSAAVTRNADVISKTGISSLIGQTEGTVFCEFQTLENLYAYIGVDDTTTTNRIIFFGLGDNKLYAQLRDATGTIFTQGTNVINGKVKAAISFNSSGSVFYANGVQIHSDLGASYSTLSQFTFNHASQIGAVINSAILFPTRLTNAELISLTTL